MKSKKILLLTLILIMTFSTIGGLAFAAVPTPQSGTNTYKSGVYWDRIGHTLIFGGVTTSLSNNDSGVISLSTTTSAAYASGFNVVELSTGELRIRGSTQVRLAGSGALRYLNMDIRLKPATFNPSSPTIGRSLIDNLFSEGTVATSTLSTRLNSGGTAWVNPVMSVRSASGVRGSHANFTARRLWKNGSSNYSTYPDRVYTTKAVTSAGNFDTQVQNQMLAFFEHRYTFPKIDLIAPSISFSPSSRNWSSDLVELTATMTDNSGGSGFKRHRFRTELDGSWGSWSDWHTSPTRFLRYTSNGSRRIQIQAEDNAGNVGSATSGYFRIDTVSPSASASPTSRDWGSSNASVSLSFSDSGSGVNNVKTAVTTSSGAPGTASSLWVDRGKISSRTETISTNGTRYVHVWVTDVAGNRTITSFGPYRVDKTAPSVSASPSSRSWGNTNASTSLSFSDTGGSGLRDVWIITDQSSSMPSDSDSRWVNRGNISSRTESFSSNGNNYVHVWARDNAGGITRSTFGPYRVDKTNPTGSISASTTSWTSGNVTLTATGSDSGGSGFYRIRKPDGTYANSTSTTYTVSSNGTYSFIFYDNAGNSHSRSITISNIDKVAPTGTLTQNPTSWTNGNVVITATGSDSGSGFYRIRKPDGTFANSTSTTYTVSSNGTYSFIFYDNAGNSYTRSITVSNIDKVAPTISLSPNSRDWGNTNSPVTITMADTGSGVNRHRYRIETNGVWGTWSGWSTTSTRTITHTDTGVYRIQVEAEDNVGNSRTSTSGDYKIDKVAPNGSFNPNSITWSNQNQSPTFTPSDSGGSGVDRWRYRVETDGTWGTWTGWNYSGASAISLTSNGRNRIQVEVRDKAGNIKAITSGYYDIDKVAPTGTLTQNPTAWTNGNVVITATGSDNDSGFYRIRKPDGTYANSTSTTYTVSSNGTYSFIFYDNVGNSYTRSITISNIDKVAPTGTLTQNPTTWTNGNVVITATGNDSGGSGFYRIRKPDGTYANSTSTTYTVSSNGTYSFIFYDNAGNSYTRSITVSNIDKVAPTTSFSPNSRDWGNTNSPVTITMADNTGGSGFNRHRYRIETNGVWGTWSGWSTTSTRTITHTDAGVYRVQVETEDNAGNLATSTSGDYKIDKVAPNGSFNPNSITWSNQNQSPTFTPSDSGGSGVDRWRYRVETDGTWGTWTGWNYSGASAINLTSDGRNRVQVEVRDNAGNIKAIISGYYEIDKVSATHINHSISGARYVNGNNYWIQSNDTIRYKMRGFDETSGIRYSYARLVGTGVDARAMHDWAAATNHLSYFRTSQLIDFTNVSRTYNNGGYREVEWTIRSHTENDYQMQYYYTDFAGNIRGYENTGMLLRIDDSAPEINLSSTRNINTGEITLTTKSTDVRSGVKTVKYQITNSTVKPTAWKIGTPDFTESLTEPGTYYMHVEATDNVGNISYVRSNSIIVVDPLTVSSLTMIDLVNPPGDTQVPISYPVATPPSVKAGYKMTFVAGINRADMVEIQIFANGKPINVYTEGGQASSIKIPTIKDTTSVEYTFWVDKSLELETVLDMRISLTQTDGGITRVITNNDIGKGFGIINGSSSRDASINLTN